VRRSMVRLHPAKETNEVICSNPEYRDGSAVADLSGRNYNQVATGA
jgi:hypothetical protein